MGPGYDINHIHCILGIKLVGSTHTNISCHIDAATSWMEICTTLVKESSDTPDLVDLITAFYQFCQNGSSIQDYNAQFCEYLHHTKAITDMDDLDLLQQYCDGWDEYKAFRTKHVAKIWDQSIQLSELMD